MEDLNFNYCVFMMVLFLLNDILERSINVLRVFFVGLNVFFEIGYWGKSDLILNLWILVIKVGW